MLKGIVKTRRTLAVSTALFQGCDQLFHEISEINTAHVASSSMPRGRT